MADAEEVEMELCLDCGGMGVLDCDYCGSQGMGDECPTCDGAGEIETDNEEKETVNTNDSE